MGVNVPSNIELLQVTFATDRSESNSSRTSCDRQRPWPFPSRFEFRAFVMALLLTHTGPTRDKTINGQNCMWVWKWPQSRHVP